MLASAGTVYLLLLIAVSKKKSLIARQILFDEFPNIAEHLCNPLNPSDGFFFFTSYFPIA